MMKSLFVGAVVVMAGVLHVTPAASGFITCDSIHHADDTYYFCAGRASTRPCQSCLDDGNTATQCVIGNGYGCIRYWDPTECQNGHGAGYDPNDHGYSEIAFTGNWNFAYTASPAYREITHHYQASCQTSNRCGGFVSALSPTGC